MTLPFSSLPQAWQPQLWVGRQSTQPYSNRSMPTCEPLGRPTGQDFSLENLPMTLPIHKEARCEDGNTSLDFYPELAKGPSKQSWQDLLPGNGAVDFDRDLLSGSHLFSGGTQLGTTAVELMQPPKFTSLGSRSSHEALQSSLAHSTVEGSASDKELEQSSDQALNPGLSQQMLTGHGDEIDRQREKNR